jgi:hypothetical protein
MKITPTKETAHQITAEAIAAKEAAAKTPSNQDAPLPIERDPVTGERMIFPDLSKFPKVTPHFSVLDDMYVVLKDRDYEADDLTPVYQWLQQISNKISKAQSGQGPMRDRYLEIAEIALAAILSIDRATERG